jgi:hypothetical protein
MWQTDYHIVRFDKWCKKCQHADLDDNDDPCAECLCDPVNTNDRQPTYFKPKE